MHIYILDLMHIKFNTMITIEEKFNINKSTSLKIYSKIKACLYIYKYYSASIALNINTINKFFIKYNQITIKYILFINNNYTLPYTLPYTLYIFKIRIRNYNFPFIYYFFIF